MATPSNCVVPLAGAGPARGSAETFRTQKQRLGYLDALRGVAALIVAVFSHYQHFSGKFLPGGARLEDAPFYKLLAPFYQYGYLSVDLFFMISGVVFAHVYGDAIATRRVGARNFALMRFTRLYPLHFATLCATAVLVYIFQYQTGRFPIYQFNGLQDFVFNLFFIQDGIINRGYSFNAPAWSLSIEAYMYVLFFLLARYGKLRPAWAYGAIAVGCAILASGRTQEWRPLFISSNVARGLIGFFLGFLIFRAGRRGVVAMLAVMAVLAIVLHREWLPCVVIWISGPLLLLLLRWSATTRRILEFPILMRLGDWSLSIYMLHFPLQLLMMVAFRAAGIAIPYTSVSFLAAYTAALLALSALVYSRFEMPVQNALRRKFDSGRSDTGPETPSRRTAAAPPSPEPSPLPSTPR